MKRDINNWARAFESTRVRYVVPELRELWSTNGLKWYQSFYPLSVNSVFYFIVKLRTRRSANGIQPNFAKR